jgi:Uma2 family endonuclease
MAMRATLSDYTADEYLEIDRAADQRSEYLDGAIVAMAGASREHSLIASNLVRELGTLLKRRPCEVHGSDLRVKVADSGLYTYPDVTVLCAEPVFLDDERDTLLNPTVIIEVLSPSTEAYDRGEKFARYRQLPSLSQYILVAQDQPRIECFTRRGAEWVLSEASGRDASIALAALDCTLELAEVYDKVAWPGDLSAPRPAAAPPQSG